MKMIVFSSDSGLLSPKIVFFFPIVLLLAQSVALLAYG